MDAARHRATLLACLLWLAAPAAWAVTDIAGLGGVDLGTWTPATGNASNFDDFCVAARRGNSQNPGPYAVRVTPLTGTRFELRSVSNPAAVIPLTLAFQDLIDGGQEALVPATFTVREQTGARTCTGTNNARLIATAASTDILAAPPGEFQGLFRLTARDVPPANELSRDFSIRLRLAELIRISGLDSIDLGAFDGVQDRRGVDDFCVYSNGLTGRYTVTGTGQGAAGAFRVQSGTASLPFVVEYDDGAGLLPMTPNLPLAKLNAVSTSIDCVGGNNASIRVSIAADDMQQAPPGVYTGEIILLVAPI